MLIFGGVRIRSTNVSLTQRFRNQSQFPPGSHPKPPQIESKLVSTSPQNEEMPRNKTKRENRGFDSHPPTKNRYLHLHHHRPQESSTIFIIINRAWSSIIITIAANIIIIIINIIIIIIIITTTIAAIITLVIMIIVVVIVFVVVVVLRL